MLMLFHGWVAGFSQDVLPVLAAAALLIFIGYVISRGQRLILQAAQQQQGSPFVEYGHLIVVTLGIVAVVAAFLITMLFSADLFQKTTQVLAVLTALFGVIGTLVGTYFGIKASSDATHTAQQQVQELTSGTSLTIVSVTPPNDVKDVPPDTPVTATFSHEVYVPSIKGTDHFTLVRMGTQGTGHVRVAGEVDYGQPNNPPRVARFVPSQGLDRDRTYQATITKGVRDLTGNTLPEDYAWQFKVKS